jgi:hypothetical protein
MIRQCNRHFNALRDELEGVIPPDMTFGRVVTVTAVTEAAFR